MPLLRYDKRIQAAFRLYSCIISYKHGVVNKIRTYVCNLFLQFQKFLFKGTARKGFFADREGDVDIFSRLIELDDLPFAELGVQNNIAFRKGRKVECGRLFFSLSFGNGRIDGRMRGIGCRELGFRLIFKTILFFRSGVTVGYRTVSRIPRGES